MREQKDKINEKRGERNNRKEERKARKQGSSKTEIKWNKGRRKIWEIRENKREKKRKKERKEERKSIQTRN